jgi:hypothetical protein
MDLRINCCWTEISKAAATSTTAAYIGGRTTGCRRTGNRNATPSERNAAASPRGTALKTQFETERSDPDVPK